MFKPYTFFWQFHVKYDDNDHFIPMFSTYVDAEYLETMGKLSPKGALEYDEKMEDLFTYRTPIEDILFPDEEMAVRYLEKYLAYADDEDIYGRSKLPVEEVTKRGQWFRTWITVGEKVPHTVITLRLTGYKIL